jgi:hypothetical protein
LQREITNQKFQAQISALKGGEERVAPMKEIRRMLKKTTTVLPERIWHQLNSFKKILMF